MCSVIRGGGGRVAKGNSEEAKDPFKNILDPPPRDEILTNINILREMIGSWFSEINYRYFFK